MAASIILTNKCDSSLDKYLLSILDARCYLRATSVTRRNKDLCPSGAKCLSIAGTQKYLLKVKLIELTFQ